LPPDIHRNFIESPESRGYKAGKINIHECHFKKGCLAFSLSPRFDSGRKSHTVLSKEKELFPLQETRYEVPLHGSLYVPVDPEVSSSAGKAHYRPAAGISRLCEYPRWGCRSGEGAFLFRKSGLHEVSSLWRK
jgi:hypothetical protein